MNSVTFKLGSRERQPTSRTTFPELEAKLRNVPSQARSRARLRRVLDAADEVLAQRGSRDAFTTTRIAEAAGIPVGSVYHYFPDKEAIVEALAVGYWSDFEDLVAGVAEADERDPLEDPCGAIVETLAAGLPRQPRLPGAVVRGPAHRAGPRRHPPDEDGDRPLGRADPRRPLAGRVRRRARAWPRGWSCSRRRPAPRGLPHRSPGRPGAAAREQADGRGLRRRPARVYGRFARDVRVVARRRARRDASPRERLLGDARQRC